LSHKKRRIWEHAVETVVLLGSLALAAVAVLPGTGLPLWLMPLVEMMLGIVIALSAWASTGRGAISSFIAFFGFCLGLWTLWAEMTRLWDSGVVTAWIIGMIVCAPLSAHAALSGLAPDQPAAPRELTAGAPPEEEDLQEEMTKFEHMFREVGCSGVQVLGLASERSGRVLRLQLPRSGKITLSTLEGCAGQIAVILRLKPGAVEFSIGEHSGDIILRLREHEVLVESPTLKKELHASTVNEPFAIGVQEDGTVLKISLRELHMYIVGTTGAGKSNLINVILAQLSYCVDTVIWAIDMKGGRTVKAWLQAWCEGNAEAPALDWVATTREEAALMMTAFKKSIETRMNSGIGGSKITPSASMPQIILLCDEMSVLFGGDRGTRKDVGEDAVTNRQFIHMAEEGVQLARSEAVTSIWATQRGTVDFAGSGNLKSLCKLRLALGAATEGDLRYVIPDAHMAQKQLSVMASTPGVGVAAVGRKASMMSKFFLHDHLEGECSENDNEGCVAGCPVYQTTLEVGSIRPRLDKLTADSLGSDYTERWVRAAQQPSLTRMFSGSGRTATAVADVDTSQFEAIVAGFEDPESKLHPARKRMRELLAGRGARGATPAQLHQWLADEKITVARETVQRWLKDDETQGIVHNPDYSRWKYGPKRDDQAA
jgi:hypothetical protein